MRAPHLSLSPIHTPSANWRERFMTARGEETTRDGELRHLEAAANRVQEIVREIAQLGDGKVRHGQHTVTHWAGDAQFHVRTDIPEWARYGVFARVGESFPGKLRLSGGVAFLQPDRVGDVRGLALDVIVDGVHQGFLATSQKTPFAADGNEFMAFSEAMLSALKAGKRNGRLLAPNKRTLFFQLFSRLRATKPNTIGGLIRAMAAGVRVNARLGRLTARGPLRLDKSLANLQFWSGGPLKFGPFAARFTLIPSDDNGPPTRQAGPRSDNYLGEEFTARLAQNEVKYTLALQFFVSEKKTPIESAYKEWDQHAIKVEAATVTVGPGTPYDPEAAEYRYTQFHTVGDITAVDQQGYPTDPSALFPLGHIQRIRELVYRASADARGGELQPIGTS